MDEVTATAQALEALTKPGVSLTEKILALLTVLGAVLAFIERARSLMEKKKVGVLIEGIEAAAQHMPAIYSKQTKASVNEIAVARGIEGVLHADVKKITKSFTVPKILGLMLICLLSGCAGHRYEQHEAAVSHQQLLKAIRETSKPVMGVATGKWEAGWNEAERGAALWEEETK